MYMSQSQKNMQSQKLLCTYMTKQPLEELVKRVVNGKLESDILREIMHTQANGEDTGFNIETSFNKSPKYTNPSDYYIIITYTYNGARHGHITFHLIYNKCYPLSSKGPLHIVNNQSNRRARLLHVSPHNTDNNCLQITIGSIWKPTFNIDNVLRNLSQAAINVFNRYLMPTSSDSLTHNLAGNMQLNGKYTNYINDILATNARCFRGGTRRQRRSRRGKTTVRRYHIL